MSINGVARSFPRSVLTFDPDPICRVHVHSDRGAMRTANPFDMPHCPITPDSSKQISRKSYIVENAYLCL